MEYVVLFVAFAEFLIGFLAALVWMTERAGQEAAPRVTVEPLPEPARPASTVNTADGRLIPLYSSFQQVAAPGFVVTQPRQQRRYPELPEGVSLFTMTAWIQASWDYRHLPVGQQVRFSEAGAKRNEFTRQLTPEQVAACKQWLIDLGWIRVVHPNGNYEITDAGMAAFPRIASLDHAEDLRIVAADYYREPAPPPRQVFLGE